MVMVKTVNSMDLDAIAKINTMNVYRFSDFNYREDLAAAATYTPPAHTQVTLANESAALNSSEMHIEFWDGEGWVNGHSASTIETVCQVFQDTDQNLRIANADALDKWMNLSGVTWAGYSADYHYYEDLAGGANYTLPAKGIATLFDELGHLMSNYIHLEFWNGAIWVNTVSTTAYDASLLLCQDNGQSQRVANGAGTAYKISLTGALW